MMNTDSIIFVSFFHYNITSILGIKKEKKRKAVAGDWGSSLFWETDVMLVQLHLDRCRIIDLKLRSTFGAVMNMNY